MLIHASCVVLDNRGVLIAGPSGMGKSDLGLRLIDDGAQLVADDQTELRTEKGKLIASTPASIAGLMEVRHIGLLRMPYALSAPVVLYVELAPQEEKLERLPDVVSVEYLGCSIRKLRLPAFAASTPAKIRAALNFEIAGAT